MHPRHGDLLAAIQRAGGPRRPGHDHHDSYGSSGHPFYRVPVPVRREIAKTWLAGDKTRPVAEILAVVESLFAGESHAPDPHRRRAAIVLLTKPVQACDDERLRELTVDRQRGDRDPLITKAVSWLLRSMVTHHRDTVVGYLAAHEAALAAIAVRETRTKLATGTKRGRT